MVPKLARKQQGCSSRVIVRLTQNAMLQFQTCLVPCFPWSPVSRCHSTCSDPFQKKRCIQVELSRSSWARRRGATTTRQALHCAPRGGGTDSPTNPPVARTCSRRRKPRVEATANPAQKHTASRSCHTSPDPPRQAAREPAKEAVGDVGEAAEMSGNQCLQTTKATQHSMLFETIPRQAPRETPRGPREAAGPGPGVPDPHPKTQIPNPSPLDDYYP